MDVLRSPRRAIDTAEPLNCLLSCKWNRERAEPNRWPRVRGRRRVGRLEQGARNAGHTDPPRGPTVTAENYRAAVEKLAGKDKLESLSDWPVGGILFHCGESPSGFRVVDVWESQDACDAFGQHLGPILEQVGITDPPEMYPAETFVSS